MWYVATKYIALGDMVCVDLNASIRISTLVGFNPIAVRRSELIKPADSVLIETVEELGNNFILLRTFSIRDRIMVGLVLVPAGSAYVKSIKNLNTKQFLNMRSIPYTAIN
jgi:hypothetical protein